MDGLLHLTTLYHLCMYTVQTTNGVTDDHVTCIKTGQQEVAVEYFTVWDIENSVYYQYDIPIRRSHSVWCVGLRPLACWDFRFEYRLEHESFLLCVFCLVEVFEMGWSFVYGSLIVCVCVCVCMYVCVCVPLNFIKCTNTCLLLK